MSNKSNGQSKIETLWGISSPEFKERWYEIMWGKDGKSGAMKEPYADKLQELIPEGLKLVELLRNRKKDV